MNGTYFKRLEGKPLPPWAAEAGCKTWAQFSLKYILSNPAVTCVLTETSNPHHMEENAQTALRHAARRRHPRPDARVHRHGVKRRARIREGRSAPLQRRGPGV